MRARKPQPPGPCWRLPRIPAAAAGAEAAAAGALLAMAGDGVTGQRPGWGGCYARGGCQDAARAGVAAGAGAARLGTLAGAGTATPGAFAALAAGAAAGAPPSLFSSLMFLDSSATRVEASLAWRSLAILSSAAVGAALPWTAPLERVSLSGVAAGGRAVFDLGLHLAAGLAVRRWPSGWPARLRRACGGSR